MPTNVLLQNSYGAGQEDRRRNALMDQQLKANEQAMQQQARMEPLQAKAAHLGNQVTQQQYDITQQENAAHLLSRSLGMIESANDPVRAAFALAQTPEFQQQITMLGGDPSMFVPDGSETPESILSEIRQFRSALTGQQRQTLQDVQGRNRYVDSGAPVFPTEDTSGLVTEADRLAARRSELELQREREARMGNELSAALEKELLDATNMAFESGNQAQELMVIANEYQMLSDDPEMSSGLRARGREWLKEAMGSEDAISLLRRRYAAVRNSLVINNLPPGVASDRDIQIAMEGFLPPTAEPMMISSFLRGMSKLEQLNSQFNEFKAQYISENRKADGLIPAWREYTKSMQSQAQPAPQRQDLGGGGVRLYQPSGMPDFRNMSDEELQRIANGG